ncbi:MoxR family ATPase [Lentisphaera profundi]|uniref:MoxR family ATPase n=1 Tax=Lentisphaera profundi TaxID=1658616 RepID=A0ABY7VS02_9BACT|nr:MoxR family ATPase [Lentisphaera profundi]WDE95995.1 MoxR family ATPase [Lentisphaera profundi]
MDNRDSETQDEIAAASAFIKPLKNEIAKVISGQEDLVDRLIIGLICSGHLLVEGVPGLAKTLTINTLAQAIKADSSRLQFTPDLLPADIVGTSIYDPREHSFSVKKGPIFANLVLADEINRAPAKVQSALLEAMQEKQVTIGSESFKLPETFMVMATQNPLDQEGTYPLPEAQMDRFMMKVLVDYPDRKNELNILRNMARPKVDVKAEAICSTEDILRARNLLDKVFIDESLQEYIVDIIMATRPGMTAQLSSRQQHANLKSLPDLISCGASPRATLSLTLAAKTRAFCQGRNYILPEDILALAPDVLRHRIIPSYEAEAEGLTSDRLIQLILSELKAP